VWVSDSFDPLPEQVSLPLAGAGGGWGGRTLPSLMLALGVMLVVAGGFTQVFGAARMPAAATGMVLGVAAVLVMSGFGAARLMLDQDGFIYSVGSKSWRRRWADCKSIKVRSTGDLVSITWTQPRPMMAPMNARPTSEEALPVLFGLKPRELVELMNLFRQRALAAKDTS
jgi:hypothetical protein